MIDTHCHIDMYASPKDIANQCEKLGIITIGMTNLPSHFELGFNHVKSYKKVRLALGMHPLYFEHHQKEMPIFIRNLSKTSYIGEIGLDFSHEGAASKNLQLNTFASILTQLKDLNKILSLHSRKAEEEVLEQLIKYKIKSAIFHWYSGSSTLIESIVNNGYYFSINPKMIKSKSGQEIISKIPQSRILTESDGPYIQINGSPIKPSDVSLVIDYLSNIWDLSKQEVEKLIDNNFKKLLSQIV